MSDHEWVTSGWSVERGKDEEPNKRKERKITLINSGKARLGDINLISTADREKDRINKNLNLNDHTNEKVHKRLGLIVKMKKPFMYVNEDMVKIITAIIRPSLEYGAMVWCIHLKKDIDKLRSIRSSRKSSTYSKRHELRR